MSYICGSGKCCAYSICTGPSAGVMFFDLPTDVRQQIWRHAKFLAALEKLADERKLRFRDRAGGTHELRPMAYRPFENNLMWAWYIKYDNKGWICNSGVGEEWTREGAIQRANRYLAMHFEVLRIEVLRRYRTGENRHLDFLWGDESWCPDVGWVRPPQPRTLKQRLNGWLMWMFDNPGFNS